MSAFPAASRVAAQLQERVCAFVRTAHDNGYPVGVSEALDAQRLLATIDVTNRWQFYWSLKTLLCSNRQQWEGFDTLFEGFWMSARRESRSRSQQRSPAAREEKSSVQQAGDSGAPAESETAGQGLADDLDDGATHDGASAQERLAGLDFQFISNTEQQREIEHLAERLARKMRKRPVRRQVNKQQGNRLNMRKTLRDSLKYGGIPLHLTFRSPRPEQPRLVVLVDVSRSMSVYSSIFLRFARGLVGHFRNADAFAFHTRLVHITDALRQPDLLRVKHHLALISTGFSGGTRLGECLDNFNRDYARSVNRRSLVIIVSDGLDTGSPAQLAAALGCLRQRCRRIVWLNPLLGRAGYETRTQSMLTVLPLLDLFAPAHNLQSLAALEPQLVNL